MDLNITEDYLLDGAIAIRQPRRGHRVTTESVLLAAATPARGIEKVLDVGAGTGAVTLCLAHRCERIRLTALECYPNYIDLLKQNVLLNKLSGRIEVVEGDISVPPVVMSGCLFNHVTTNPPFGKQKQTQLPKNLGRRVARHEGDLVLKDWITSCFKLILPGGSLTMVIPESRFFEAVKVLSSYFSTLRVLPLIPRSGHLPRRLILQGWVVTKQSYATSEPLQLHPDRGNGYTEAAEAILRRGSALDLAIPLAATAL